ncbi:tail completion protein gp17 [Nitratireductor thuwali]|uniref:DUF3168 domain-containing protein n=1 Tax=Nitratireductor thuwali TaxID=2267699 RepID=A0ABY5MNV8_9HYPH|nr:hypothetical protein NTH_04010 [Nitratireductor thuwali]
MEEALVSLLVSVAGGRRYWGRKPQKNPDGSEVERPYAVLKRITGLHDYHLQGASGYVQSRVQIDCYGETYTSSKHTARAVIAILSGFRGTVAGTFIQGIFIDSERDLPAADAGEVTHLFRTSIDVFIHHSE